VNCRDVTEVPAERHVLFKKAAFREKVGFEWLK
jgi:hypothetical protein